MSTYFENFDSGPGGWMGWKSNAAGPQKLAIEEGVVVCQSPWWVDYNHAPPGAGYLQILMGLPTHDTSNDPFSEGIQKVSGSNRFVEEDRVTDLRGATVTLRLRGQIDLQGAELLFHVQSHVNGRWVNYILTGQPFEVSSEWTEQSIRLDPDPSQWTCLGSRHDRQGFYGEGPLEQVLAEPNGSVILVLFPLDIVPATEISGNPHLLRAGEDYALDHSRLPQGHISFDWVRIEMAPACVPEAAQRSR
jgi:hypothetical protein